MKKYILILSIMIITCVSSLKAQTFVSGYSSYIGDDGEWTEWIEENVEIKLDIRNGKITLFDPVWLAFKDYKIIRTDKGVYDEDDDFVTVYHCKGEDDLDCTVRVTDLVATDPGKLQITFLNDNEAVSYHVMRAEEE
jgi:hypothetical protein